MSDHFSDEPERMTTSETGGNKAEKDLQLGALDPRALMEVARVAGVGAKKYGFPSPEEKPQAPQAERDQAWLVVQTEAERKERLRVLSEMGRDELLAVIRGFENL